MRVFDTLSLYVELFQLLQILLLYVVHFVLKCYCS